MAIEDLPRYRRIGSRLYKLVGNFQTKKVANNLMEKNPLWVVEDFAISLQDQMKIDGFSVWMPCFHEEELAA